MAFHQLLCLLLFFFLSIMSKNRIFNYDELNPPADQNLTPAMVVIYIQFLFPCCYYFGIALITRINNGLNISLMCCMSLLFSLSFKERKRDKTSNRIPIRRETSIGMQISNPVLSILWCIRIASSILHNSGGGEGGGGGGGGGDSYLYSIFVIMLLLY